RETSDARFEFVWPGQNIFGVSFQVDLAIREIEVQPGSQIRLGREYALHFSGLTDTIHSAPATTAVPTPPFAPARPAAPVLPAPAASGATPCRDKQFCQAAGPFVAQVVGLTRSNLGLSYAAQVVQMRVRFTNLVAAPIILGYVRDTAMATDD